MQSRPTGTLKSERLLPTYATAVHQPIVYLPGSHIAYIVNILVYTVQNATLFVQDICRLKSAKYFKAQG